LSTTRKNLVKIAYAIDAQSLLPAATPPLAKDLRKHGCFHVVGAPNGAAALQKIAMSRVVVIAEGYATAATLAEHGKVSTLAAYDSGNLFSVATSIREPGLTKRSSLPAMMITGSKTILAESGGGGRCRHCHLPKLQRRTAQPGID
jgi:hypothetical protein